MPLVTNSLGGGHTGKRACAHTHIHTHTHTHTHTHIHTHTYIHTHIHTHMHTCRYLPRKNFEKPGASWPQDLGNKISTRFYVQVAKYKVDFYTSCKVLT